MPVWSLGREDPLEEVWQPTRVLLPGESPGQRSLVGYGAWGCKESDTTERLSMPCMTIVKLCEYAEKTELYTRWWVISQYSRLPKKRASRSKWRSQVHEESTEVSKAQETLKWGPLLLRRSPVPLRRHAVCSCFLFIPRGVIHSQKQINSIWPKPVAVLLNPIKNTRAKYRLAYEIRGRDTDGCKEGN